MKFKKLLQFLKNEGYADDIVKVIEDPSRFNELNNDLTYHADEDVKAEYRALQRQAKGEPELAILNLVENQMDADAGTMIDAPTSQKSLDFSQPEIGDLPGGDVELNPFEQLPPEAQKFLTEKGYGPESQDPKAPFTAEDYLSALEREGFGTTESVVPEDTGPSFEEVRAYAQQNDTPFGRLPDEDARVLYDGGYGEGPDAPAMGEQQIAAMLAHVKGEGPKRTGGPARATSVGVGSKMDELDSVQKNEKKFVDSLREALPDSQLYGAGVTDDPKNVLSGGVGADGQTMSAGGNDNPSGTTPAAIEQRISDGIKAYQAATAPSQSELSGFRTKSSEGAGGQTMSAGDVQKFVNNPDLKNPVTVAEARNTGGAVPVAAPIDVAGATGGNQFFAGMGAETPGSVITDAINQTEALANMQQNPVTKSLLDGNEPNANTPQPQQKNPFASTAGMKPEPVATPAPQQAAAAPPQPGFFSRDQFSGDLRDGSTKGPALFGATGFLPGRFQGTPYPVTQATQNLFETVIPNPRAAQFARVGLTGGLPNLADFALRHPVYSTIAGLTAMNVRDEGDAISEQQAMDGSVPGVAMRMDEDGNVIPVETPIAAPATEEMQMDLQSQADQALKNFGDFVTGQSQFKKLEANQQQLRQEDNIRKLREGI